MFGIETYEKLMRELELLREVRTSEDEVAAGQFTEHEGVAIRLRALLGR